MYILPSLPCDERCWRLTGPSRRERGQRPGYRDKTTRTQYIVKLAGQRVRWSNADFEKVECEPEICQATWVIHWIYSIPVRGAGMYDGEKPTLENWILADGEWYFVPSM